MTKQNKNVRVVPLGAEELTDLDPAMILDVGRHAIIGAEAERATSDEQLRLFQEAVVKALDQASKARGEKPLATLNRILGE